MLVINPYKNYEKFVSSTFVKNVVKFFSVYNIAYNQN